MLSSQGCPPLWPLFVAKRAILFANAAILESNPFVGGVRDGLLYDDPGIPNPYPDPLSLSLSSDPPPSPPKPPLSKLKLTPVLFGLVPIGCIVVFTVTGVVVFISGLVFRS